MAIAFMCFMLVGIDKEFGEDFWSYFCIMLVVQIVMIALWIPEGKKKGLLDEKFIAVTQSTNKMIGNVKGKYEQLDKFCKIATAQNRYEWVVSKVAKIGINYDAYKTGKLEISAKDKKRIERIEKRSLLVRGTIKPTEITSNTTIGLVYDLKNHERAEQSVSIGFKVFTSILTSFLTASLTFGVQEFSMAHLTKFLFSISTMISTIYFALNTGIQLITVTRKAYYVSICDFLERFEDWLAK